MPVYIDSFAKKRSYTQKLSDLVALYLPGPDEPSYNEYIKLYSDLHSCGTFLQFAVPSVGDPRLYRANFCKQRICPMCNWRRSKALFSQLSSVLNYLGDQYSYYFLTLTIVSKHGDRLSDQLQLILSAWDRFFHRREIKRSVRGYYRSIEVTYNRSRDWFHPHIHCLLCFDSSVEPPISQSSFLKYWQAACNDPSISQVDLTSCYSSDGQSSSVRSSLEAAKYACKFSDFYFSDSPSLSWRVLNEFRSGLASRRLISFGGVFSFARKQLRLLDPEDQFTDDCNDLIDYVVRTYRWGSSGAYVVLSDEVVL